MTPAEKPARVNASAAIVEPDTLALVWSSEPLPEDAGAQPTLGDAMPLAEQIGAAAAIADALADGEPRHLATDVVSTNRGSMALVVSVYPLPDGRALLLSENTWRSGRKTPYDEDAEPRRRHRRY